MCPLSQTLSNRCGGRCDDRETSKHPCDRLRGTAVHLRLMSAMGRKRTCPVAFATNRPKRGALRTAVVFLNSLDVPLRAKPFSPAFLLELLGHLF